MNPPSGPRRSAPHRASLVGGAGTAHWRRIDHPPVSVAARATELVHGKRSDDDARANRIDSCTASPPANRFGHDGQRIPPFLYLVSVQPVRHSVGLKEIKVEKLVTGVVANALFSWTAQRR
jgi:hypothetical protein